MSISRSYFPDILIPGMGPGLGLCIFSGTPPSLALISRGWQKWGCREEGKGCSCFFRANVCPALVWYIFYIMMNSNSFLSQCLLCARVSMDSICVLFTPFIHSLIHSLRKMRD